VPRDTETYKRLAPGIYAVYEGRTKIALRANVRVHGALQNSARYSPETNLSVLKAWREDQRVAGRTQGAPVTPAGFAADAATYLASVAAMPSYDGRKHDIDAWIAVFGAQARATITSADVATQLSVWRKTFAASTVNHRRTALQHLWRRLDGKSAANPVRDVPKFAEPEPESRSLSYETVRAILAAMADTATRARVAIIAFTGLTHSSIARLTARDLDLDRGILVRPARRKGAGTRRQAVPLTKDAVLALQRLVELGGLGKPFSNSSLHKALRLACDKVQTATGVDLAGVRPYDLRHSYGTALYKLHGDERAVQQLLGHARIETTHRYTLGGVDARLQAAVDAFDGQ